MSTRLLEFNSAYRDRHNNPNPAQFSVSISQTETTADVFSALNPISKNYPFYAWHGFASRSYMQAGWISHVESLPGPLSTTPANNLVESQFTGGNRNKPLLNISARSFSGGVKDYFAGAMLVRVPFADPATEFLESARITGFDPATTELDLEFPLSSLDVSATTGDYWIIVFNANPFTLDDEDLFISVLGGDGKDNHYTGMFLEDIILNQDAPTAQDAVEIVSYVGAHRKANLTALPAGWTRTYVVDSNGDSYNSIWHNMLIRKSVVGLVRAPVSYSGATNLYTGGTGDVPPAKGCAWEVTVLTAGTGYTAVNTTVNTGSMILLPTVSATGAVLSVEIRNPGLPSGGYEGQATLILSGGNGDCTLRVTKTGYGIDLTNASAQLSSTADQYVGSFFYLPSDYLIQNSPGFESQLYPSNQTTDVGPTWPKQFKSSIRGSSTIPARVSTASARPETGTRGIRKYCVDDAIAVTRSVVLDSSFPIAIENFPPVATVYTLQITTAFTGAGNVVITLGGAALAALAVVNSAGDANDSATQIGVANHTPWADSVATDTITFTHIWLGDRTGASSVDWGTSGGAGTITEVTQGDFGIGGLTAGSNLYFEILQYDGDSHHHFDFAGIRSSEQGIFEIELKEITIPNITLDNGGTIENYSYLYVELGNNSPVTGLIGSNNPFATTAQFRVAVDNSNTSNSSFVKFKGDSTIQKMQFQQNGTIKFRAFLPTGENLIFETKDAAPPSEPIEALQVSALFSAVQLSTDSSGLGGA